MALQLFSVKFNLSSNLSLLITSSQRNTVEVYTHVRNVLVLGFSKQVHLRFSTSLMCLYNEKGTLR